MFRYILTVIFLLVFLSTQNSCSRDELAENTDICDDQMTYDNTMRPIIDESCAYSGCHDGAAGIGPGNYTIFGADLERDLSNGLIRSRVVDQKDNGIIGMPPDQTAYEESLKDDLTTEELDQFICWLDNGFPEN